LGLLATIALEVVPFRAYSPFLALLPCLNAPWKSCSVRVLSTACDSALITSIVSKWRPLVLSSIGATEKSPREASQASRVSGGRQPCCFW
jgi:hypothetical protein